LRLRAGQEIHRGGEADRDYGDGVTGVAADREEDGGDRADRDDGDPGSSSQGHWAGILAEMADGETNGAISRAAAEGALAYLAEMSPDLRGAAIIGADGAVLAASDRPDRWREDAAALFEVADRAGAEPVEQIHIGTEQGEVFALRHAGLTAVAVTERLALASLTFFDMRSLLRDLAGDGPTSTPPDGGRGGQRDRDEEGDAA
jgi:predicted regulator of Ras-like GTPase activity (Roadblock/LC7/MglB family)